MELGSYSQAEHQKIATLVNEMRAAKKIFVGTGFNFIRTGPDVLYFETSAQLKEWFRSQTFNNYHMLVKGSRKNELEKIFKD
jgi:UDP-N-acetylmuramoyl-tripeptide--D-alanyl-D-alanine ligase